jgi:hypothetical protein
MKVVASSEKPYANMALEKPVKAKQEPPSEDLFAPLKPDLIARLDDVEAARPSTTSAPAEAPRLLVVLGWLALILFGGFLGLYIGARIGDALNPPVEMFEWRMYVIYGALIGAVVGAITLPMTVSLLIRWRHSRAIRHQS